MSDEKTQAERDAAAIDGMRLRIEQAKAVVAWHDENKNAEELFTEEAKAICALLRTIDALTARAEAAEAERDAMRVQRDKMHNEWGYLFDIIGPQAILDDNGDEGVTAKRIIAERDRLRAALDGDVAAYLDDLVEIYAANFGDHHADTIADLRAKAAEIRALVGGGE